MKKCYICKGILSKEKIRHFHQWGDKVVLFENLEVEKCTQCGEVFLDPQTLSLIDQKAEEIFFAYCPAPEHHDPCRNFS